MAWGWPWDKRFDEIEDFLVYITKQLRQISNRMSSINEKEEDIMALVKVDQEILDQFVADFNMAIDEVAAEIQALVDNSANSITDADVTGLNDALNKLRDLDTPAPAPAPTE